jgi:hypothetical protein
MALIVTPIFASQVQASNEQRSPVTNAQRPVAARASSAGAARPYTEYARMPLRFERAGRLANGAYDFIARGAGYAMFLSGGDATVVLGSETAATPEVIRIRLVGGHEPAAARGRHELPGRANYFIGSDRSEWHTGVPSYRQIEYRRVYRGIDLVYHGSQQELEYDFVVGPGARPSEIAFTVDGAERLSLDRGGNLVITTKAGELVHHAPVIYQEKDGGREPVRGRYIIRRNGLVGFEVGDYDRRRPLVIDPVLSYSTYLGGANQERSNGIAVDTSGGIVIVGETFSADFPAPGVRSPLGDVFVAKLNPATNQLDYVTYLGGSNHETSHALKLDAAGYAYVAGETLSFDFPTTPGAFQSLRSGISDSFVVKLNPSGGIAYSTFLGGAGQDFADGLAVDGTGRVHLAGFTSSGDFPTAHPLQDSLGGNPVLRSTDSGNTWVGLKAGLTATSVNSFAIDPANPSMTYAGTDSGVFKSTDGGATWMRAGEVITWPVHQLAIAGNTIFAATAVGVFRSQDGGGSWSGPSVYGDATSIAVIPGSPLTVYAGFGFNGSTPGVFVSTDGGDTWTDSGLGTAVVAMSVGGTTVYVATQTGVVTNSGAGWSPETQLSFGMFGVTADPSNPAVAYATAFDGLFRTVNGGADWTPVFEFGGTFVIAVAIAPSNPLRVYVLIWNGLIVSDDGGQTWNFAGAPTQSAFSMAVDPQTPTTVYLGSSRGPDAFIATLSPDGSSLEYATYFGGSGSDNATDLALDANGGRYITGTTQSTDLPVANALQPTAGGLMDVFVAKIAADGSLAYATYLAGWHADYASKVAVDTLGQAHVTGLTLSTNFPVVNAFQPTLGGGFSDVFVSVLNPAGNGLVFSTFLGGNGMENDNTQSVGPKLAVTPDGTTYVAGSTMSANFPRTADAIQSVYAGGIDDGFVTKISPTGQLQFSTLIGGAGTDNVGAIAVDGQGTVVITGYTDSANWPVNNAFQSSYAGSEDAFIATIAFAPPDTTPPVTSIALTGTPGLAGWYRSAVQVTLSASDGSDGSGVKKIEYRVNGGSLQTYGGPFVVSADGSTTINAQATDKANNVETPPASAAVVIDSIAPAISIASPQARDYSHSERVSISFTATDAVSGVSGTPSAALDGAPVAGDTINLLTLALGSHTLTVAAQDVAGNPSTQSVTFRIVATTDSLLASLDAFATQMNLSVYNTLRAKLTGARDALGRGSIVTARNKLEEVIDYCQRQSGQTISVVAAASLIADAQYVVGTL